MCALVKHQYMAPPQSNYFCSSFSIVSIYILSINLCHTRVPYTERLVIYPNDFIHIGNIPYRCDVIFADSTRGDMGVHSYAPVPCGFNRPETIQKLIVLNGDIYVTLSNGNNWVSSSAVQWN